MPQSVDIHSPTPFVPLWDFGSVEHNERDPFVKVQLSGRQRGKFFLA